MDAISNLIFNSLAKHEGVRFPGIGSLKVVYNAASMDNGGRRIPPSNQVVFSKEEPAEITSVVDLIEYSVGAGQGEAESLYAKWVERMRGEEEIAIENVGEIKQDFFHISPKLYMLLNSAANPAGKAASGRGGGARALVLWVVLAVLIGAALSIGVIMILEKGKNSDKTFTQTEAPGISASTENQASAPAEQPAAVPAATPSAPATPPAAATTPPRGGKVYYVVAGVFTIDSNADKFIAQAKARGIDAQFSKVPYYGKTLVSAYTARDKADADRMRRQFSSQLDELWVREETAR